MNYHERARFYPKVSNVSSEVCPRSLLMVWFKIHIQPESFYSYVLVIRSKNVVSYKWLWILNHQTKSSSASSQVLFYNHAFDRVKNLRRDFQIFCVNNLVWPVWAKPNFHIICSILYGPYMFSYNMDHIIWPINYGL